MRTHIRKHMHRGDGEGGVSIHSNEETHYQIYEGWSHQSSSFCCDETSSERKSDWGEIERGRRRDEGRMRRR